MLKALAGVCKTILLKMTSEATANFCGIQSTINSMKSFVSRALWHCLNMEWEIKRQPYMYIWLWSSAMSVTLVMLLASLKHTGQSLELVISARTRQGKKHWHISQSRIQTRTKANVRQMFCRFKVKNDTLCKAYVVTEISSPENNISHFYPHQFLPLTQGTGSRITGLCGEILFSRHF